MKKMLLSLTFLSFFAAPAIQSASAELHCQPCPYTCEILDMSKNHCDFRESKKAGSCCVDLDEKGMKDVVAIDQRIAIEAKQVKKQENTCPPGFSPSDKKCSPNERKKGCKDVRLNSGLGCVNRNPK